LLRTLYYETEVALGGGPWTWPARTACASPRSGCGANSPTGLPEAFEAYATRHYPSYWLKVERARQVKQARFVREAEGAGRSVATAVETDQFRGVTELTVLSPDHPRLLAIVTGACAAAGGNIVDAQIFTTADGMALDTIVVSRAFRPGRGRAAPRRAGGLRHRAGAQGRGEDRRSRGREAARQGAHPHLPRGPRGVDRQRALEPPDRHRGLGSRPAGPLYDLTTALGKLNLNIASAHIATFGEKAVDVFYVTDLTGTKVNHPGRQAAIRRALLDVFDRDDGQAEQRRSA
jgi:[protein-PII] uridylyltransferase